MNEHEAPMQEATRKATWRFYLLCLLIVAIIVGALLHGIETTDVCRADHQTMRDEIVTSWTWYGIRLRRTFQTRDTLLSYALAEKGLTTGCKGSTVYGRRRRSMGPCPWFGGRDIGARTIPGRRVRLVAFSPELADLVRKEGKRSLPYLRTVITEASDYIGFPNWSYGKAVETAKKLDQAEQE